MVIAYACCVHKSEGNQHMTIKNNGLTYEEMVAKLIKSPDVILEAFTPHQASLIHSAMGVAGEAGELIDAVKKHVIYQKPLDVENMIEELGDLEFYMQDLREKIGVTRDQCLMANMQKLAKRYAGYGYTDKQAHDRNDKLPENADIPDQKVCQQYNMVAAGHIIEKGDQYLAKGVWIDVPENEVGSIIRTLRIRRLIA